MKRTPLVTLSRIAHLVVNRIAWKFAPEPSYDERHKPGYKRPWLWRLNDWVARPSVDWYVYKKTGKTREEWSKK